MAKKKLNPSSSGQGIQGTLILILIDSKALLRPSYDILKFKVDLCYSGKAIEKIRNDKRDKIGSTRFFVPKIQLHNRILTNLQSCKHFEVVLLKNLSNYRLIWAFIMRYNIKFNRKILH